MSRTRVRLFSRVILKFEKKCLKTVKFCPNVVQNSEKFVYLINDCTLSSSTS
jgi:hypothetical protein